ncbi:MAG: adenylate/guanylate cyclase domain-containing protein [Thermoproteota archaeon]|jgi:adenylate cyclase|nr:adenylate/guanylate cyclase domain-containing protein [Thermoproteota archaeon]
MKEGESTSSNTLGHGDDYQRQTVLNLYNSGIEEDIISQQLDLSKEHVQSIIKREEEETQRRKGLLRTDKVSENSTPSLASSFYLDAVVDIRLAIRNAETRMWKALKSEPSFDISMEETHRILQKYARSKVTLLILHVDLVGSTQLSMTLPLDRLTTIVQTFTQEMSIMISLYGGYVLKYIGDAVLAFFTIDSLASSDDNQQIELQQQYLPCINAINCAMSMIKVIREGINPILNQYDYPEMAIRIGMDIGKSAVIQYGWNLLKLDNIVIKEPHLDILGHTVNVAVKMTRLAKPNSFVVGQFVYDTLDENQRSTFDEVSTRNDTWTYTNEKTGGVYRVYRHK